ILWAVLDIITIIVLGSGLYLWLARGRNTPASPDRSAANPRAKALAASNRNALMHGGLRQTWQIPVLVAAATTVGLIAALVGDGWHDSVSWAALAVPVGLI